MAQFLDYLALMLADGAGFEVKPLSHLKVGEVLPHEGKEALLVGREELGEVVEDFAGLCGVGLVGHFRQVGQVGRISQSVEVILAVAVGECAAALPDNPCRFLQLRDFRTQRFEMLC